MNASIIAEKRAAEKSLFDESTGKRFKLDGASDEISSPVSAEPVARGRRTRLKITTGTRSKKFIYGNYSKYYNYRCKGEEFRDTRLDLLASQATFLQHKDVLDVGCNIGMVTSAVAQRFAVKSIVGIDIDAELIAQANKKLRAQRCNHNFDITNSNYPFNIKFVHANYILDDDVLLEIEHPQFDVILCMSITKWMHLNFGDSGLKQAFRRMFLQLRAGGRLILEAQSFDGYRKRSQMTEDIKRNYKAIKFFPNMFCDYLLSPEVGFASIESLGTPSHNSAGFSRPLTAFIKL